MGGAESVEVSCNPPVLQVPGLVLDNSECGGGASDEFEQPVREWNDGLVGMVNPGVDVDDGWGSGADIGVGEACDSEVVHLLDPLGGSIDAFRGEDLEAGVMAIILDVARRGSGESVLVVQDLLLQTGESVVERVDRLFVILFPLFDGFGKAFNDVGEEGDSELGWIALKEVEGGPRGEWRALVAWVVEHADRVKEWRIQGGTLGGVNSLERSKDCSSGVVGRRLWRGVGGRDPKLNGERRSGSGGNKWGDRTSGSRGHGGFDGGVDGVVRHCAMVEELSDDCEETVVVFILSRGCLRW